jgi:hypothetical protein
MRVAFVRAKPVLHVIGLRQRLWGRAGELVEAVEDSCGSSLLIAVFLAEW